MHSLGVEGQQQVANAPASRTAPAPLPLEESGQQSNGTPTGRKSPPADDAFEVKLATCDRVFSTATNVLGERHRLKGNDCETPVSLAKPTKPAYDNLQELANGKIHLTLRVGASSFVASRRTSYVNACCLEA